MSDVAVGIYGILVLLFLFLTGLEMAYCMMLVGFLGFTFLMTFPAASSLVIKDFFDFLVRLARAASGKYPPPEPPDNRPVVQCNGDCDCKKPCKCCVESGCEAGCECASFIED